MILLLLACRVAPPGPFTVTLEQQAPNRDLHATSSEAATLAWFVDGTPVEFDARVPASQIRPGSHWRVVATGADGATAEAEHTVGFPPETNVLVLLLDDVGVDKVTAYDGAYAPPTPTLDRLAAEGVQFTRAYASPVCSPTRGILLTGRHARRNRLGWIVDTGGRNGFLPLEATTIPEALPAHWSNSAVGKWHLAGPQAPDWLDHPNASGFDWFAGSPGNPYYAEGLGYWDWDRNENGVVSQSLTYMTTDAVDTALERIEVMPEPWFLYVAFNAVHGPLSTPPEALVPGGLPADDAPSDVRYDAILQALDTELGRLFASMDPEVLARTTILTIGDNGTGPNGLPPEAVQGRGKHTPFEGGIRVPFLVNGPLVARPGSTSDALIHVADVLPTVMEIAGVPLEGDDGEHLVPDEVLDGRSLVRFLEDPDAPGRSTIYAEAFYPNGVAKPRGDRRALQNHTHKLVRWDDREEFYRLEGPGLLDVTDLLADGASLSDEDQGQYDALRLELDSLELELSL